MDGFCVQGGICVCVCSSENCIVPGRGQALVKTDLSVAIPPGTYGRVAPRSGLALKKSIDTGAGVIDEDYRGPLGVILFNFSDQDFESKLNDARMPGLIPKGN